MTGVALGYAALCGIIRARASGEGGDIDVSLFDVALSNLGYPAIWYLNAGHVQERLARSAHPSLTPCQLYKTADGWIYLLCNKEKFWPVLCDALGHAEWAGDPRFKTFEERFENRPLIQDMLDQALSAKTTAEWLAEFAGIVPAAPINDVGEALENPFVRDQGRLQDIGGNVSAKDGLPGDPLDLLVGPEPGDADHAEHELPQERIELRQRRDVPAEQCERPGEQGVEDELVGDGEGAGPADGRTPAGDEEGAVGGFGLVELQLGQVHALQGLEDGDGAPGLVLFRLEKAVGDLGR